MLFSFTLTCCRLCSPKWRPESVTSFAHPLPTPNRNKNLNLNKMCVRFLRIRNHNLDACRSENAYTYDFLQNIDDLGLASILWLSCLPCLLQLRMITSQINGFWRLPEALDCTQMNTLPFWRRKFVRVSLKMKYFYRTLLSVFWCPTFLWRT